MDKELLSFTHVKPNQELIDKIWAFNIDDLDSTDDRTLSKYVIVLGQWLIYYKAQVNVSKSKLNSLQSDFDTCVSAAVAQIPDVERKRYGTKGELIASLLMENPVLVQLDIEIKKIRQDLTIVDGMDKAITELIAAFKRELTRRESELYTLRKERYGS